MGNCFSIKSPIDKLKLLYPNYYLGTIHCYFDQIDASHVNPDGVLLNPSTYLVNSDLKVIKNMISWEVTKSCALSRKGICLPYRSFALFQKQELSQLMKPILANYQKKLNSKGYIRNPLRAQLGSDADYYVIPYLSTRVVTFTSK
jgi:hypothetical protein